MTATARLTFYVVKLFDERAAVAGGAIKLNGGMGDMEFVRQFMLNPVE
jgi:hypothetical protein